MGGRVTEWRWFDVLLPLCVVALVAVLAVKGAQMRAAHAAQNGPCDWGSGPCGCVPDHGECRMPCVACCDGGCKAQGPPPTGAR
jgi:hypothetical protein